MGTEDLKPSMMPSGLDPPKPALPSCWTTQERLKPFSRNWSQSASNYSALYSRRPATTEHAANQA
jgi:hypothetical protein